MRSLSAPIKEQNKRISIEITRVKLNNEDEFTNK